MQTIEQMEADLAAKIGLARTQLGIFYNNIGRIGTVIGKDASSVYQKLLGFVDQTEKEYTTTTLRNTAILFKWQHTLDQVLDVLKEVMASIDQIESGEDPLNVKANVEMILNKASDAVDTINNYIVNYVSPDTNPQESQIFKYIMLGTATYLTLRLLKVSPVVSALGAVGVALLLGRKSEPAAPSVPLVQPPDKEILA